MDGWLHWENRGHGVRGWIFSVSSWPDRLCIEIIKAGLDRRVTILYQTDNRSFTEERGVKLRIPI